LIYFNEVSQTRIKDVLQKGDRIENIGNAVAVDVKRRGIIGSMFSDHISDEQKCVVHIHTAILVQVIRKGPIGFLRIVDEVADSQ